MKALCCLALIFSEKKKNSSLNVVTLAYRKGASTAVLFRA